MFKCFIFSSSLCLAFAAHWCCHKPANRQAMLDLNLKDNNHDGDAYVSAKDIHYDLTHHFDENKDGKVSVYEWAKRWNCRYGDSYDYATWMFHGLTKGSDDLVISSFLGPANPGIPLQAFRDTNEKRYATYAKLHSS